MADKKRADMPNEALSKVNILAADYKELAKKKLDPKIEAMREEESRMVTGVFRCMEPIGGSVSFSFRKYPGEPVRRYDFEDGRTYTIPLSVARHLNSNCAWPVHKNAIDPLTDRPKPEIGKWVKRFMFQSNDYFDVRNG